MSDSRLAAAAATEYQGRERFYPDDVRQLKISVDDANHDWLCWKSIDEWLSGRSEHPKLSDWNLTWDDLVAAARRALARREGALAGANDKTRLGLEQRRDGVASILKHLERWAERISSLNQQLRADAQDRRRAKEAA